MVYLMDNRSYLFCVSVFLIFLSGCSTNQQVKIDLMEAPGIYAQRNYDALGEDLSSHDTYPKDIFYVTQRVPSNSEIKDQPRFYQHERGYALRGGTASIGMGDGENTWDDLAEVFLSSEREKAYPTWIDAVHEYGILEDTISSLRLDPIKHKDALESGPEFIAQVNKTLAQSRVKDIYIFVHGYKAYFDTPVLVGAQLWHYLGYQGAFVAYSWPSTPNSLAYGKDIETANYSGMYLHRFLNVLAKHSEAERIHVIGFSAGGRVVINALKEMALVNGNKGRAQMLEQQRLGEVVLISSDYDSDNFLNGIEYGMLKLMRGLTVYSSQSDDALGFSHFILGRERLGQFGAEGGKDILQEDIDQVPFGDHLYLVNATRAENAGSGNGHSYFRNSPWVSSDLLTLLRYQLAPGNRGLVRRNDGSAIWTFPDNYIEALNTQLSDTISLDEK
ncbi:Uncharacterised protein [BD1-7 clade bacterium]|uniref:Alpha/beta hydrolase n=1 Tax=BD1-7 clade bacterium TaxID=2029982 RepID=A0A5S9PPW8_9GAMM|nr:Uncharacterised protein [BD1-7 clade bacterium]